MSWEMVVVLLGAIGAGSTAVVKLLQHIAAKGLDVLADSHAKRLELDNASALERLRLTHARELESFKARLQVASHEAQARTSALVVRQSEVVAEMYKLMAVAENTMHAMMRPVRRGSEAKPIEILGDSVERLNAFVRHYVEHRIFLAPDVAEAVEGVATIYRQAESKFTLWGVEGEPDDDLRHERYEAQTRAWELIQVEAQKARAALEAQFRNLLSVTRPDASEGAPDDGQG